MSLLDRLESKFSRFAVPHVTLAIIFGQLLVYCPAMILSIKDPEGEAGEHGLIAHLELAPLKVLEGEVWRSVTFVLVPPLSNPVCALLGWYCLWLMGSTLELEWGTFRYNIYLLIGCLATIGLSFVHLDHVYSNGFLLGSIFLAFAFLYPDFEIRLFFLLPIKIKWLALLVWIGYGLALVFGGWDNTLMVVAATANFVLFFRRELWARMKQGHRSMTWRSRQLATARQPSYYHRCVVCGVTDRTDPDMDFRYCSKCVGSCGYCTKHLHAHDHITEERPAARPES